MTFETLKKCAQDEDDSADRIDFSHLRQRFLCADTVWQDSNSDDLISIEEFGNILDVAAGGQGESVIEAKALHTPTTDDEEAETLCAQIYLDADTNKNRILSKKETKDTFLDNANTGLAQTNGEKLARFRQFFKSADDDDDKALIWSEFLETCKLQPWKDDLSFD